MPRGATIDRTVTIRHFVQIRTMLQSCGMLKRPDADVSGWQDIVCPWTDGHTDQANNGAAICEPNGQNGWNGAFHCHHGSCAGRGWRELTDWAAEHDAEILDLVNRKAVP